MKKILYFVIASLLIGCGATGIKFQVEESVDDESALIYVYRSPTFIGIINFDVPFIKLNGKTIGNIKIGGYYPLHVKPGRHTITTVESLFGKDTGRVRGKTVIEIGKGEVAYLKYGEYFKDITIIPLPYVIYFSSTGDFKFQYVEKQKALVEITKTKRL